MNYINYNLWQIVFYKYCWRQLTVGYGEEIAYVRNGDEESAVQTRYCNGLLQPDCRKTELTDFSLASAFQMPTDETYLGCHSRNCVLRKKYRLADKDTCHCCVSAVVQGVEYAGTPPRGFSRSVLLALLTTVAQNQRFALFYSDFVYNFVNNSTVIVLKEG